MKEWKEFKLGDLAEIQTGPFGSQLHASDYVKTGIPSIMPTNIGQRLEIDTNQIVFVDPKDVERLRKYKVLKNDIVYSRRGDVEKCAFIGEKEDGWLCGTGCLRIRFSSPEIVPKFAAYYLSTPDIKSWISNSAVGTTMPNLNSSILTRLPINIPSIVIQEVIVDTLTSLDDKIDLLHRQNKTLEATAETLFRQWFVEEAEESWELGKLGSFIDSTLGGEWGKEEPDGDFQLQAQCIRGTDIADLRSGLPQRTPTRFIKIRKFESIRVRDGDLVMEISGGTDNQSTGRTAYVNKDVEALFEYPLIFSNFCRLIRPKKPEYSFFIYSFINYLYNQGELYNLENGSSGIKNLNYKALLFELDFRLPDVDYVVRYHKYTSSYFKKINKNKLQILTLMRLRNDLLPKLMNGDILVSG